MPHRYKLNKIDYNYVAPNQALPDDTIFRIQPSSLSAFFDNTSTWYAEKLLREKPRFLTSTSATLGSALHFAAECYIKDKAITPENRQEMYDYIMLQSENNPDLVNEVEVRAQLTPMWVQLRSHIDANPVSIVEPSVYLDILPGIQLGGSIDAIRILGEDQNTSLTVDDLRGKRIQIVDWKTTGALTAPSKISRAYWFQLITYAYIMETKYGAIVESINNTYITRNNVNRIGSTGKPIKDYPSTVSTVDLPYDSSEMVKGIANLIAHSITRFVTTPHDRFLLMQDARYINNTQPLPFTSVGAASPEDI